MKRTVRITIWVAFAVAVALAAAAAVFWLRLNATAVTEPSILYVPTGATYQTLLDSLGGDGHRIRDVNAFRSTARLMKFEKGVKPGRYELRKGMSYRSVVQMLSRGLQSPVKLTFNNLRTPELLAGAIARQIEADSMQMLAFFRNPAFEERYGFGQQTLLAMFIPNTYEVYWTTSPEALCDRMKKEYDKFWSEERLAKARAVNLTPVEVSTLASIVYEETKKADEMPRVAGVYLNRLKIGMPLQADPTLKFAAGDFTLRRVLDRHKLADSPYNTYMYKGLPPGPICMPSIRALDAVLNPEKHNYLYFCAAPDFSGYHRFSATLAGHEQNRQAYIRFLNANGIR